jgi:hypothetical protein
MLCSYNGNARSIAFTGAPDDSSNFDWCRSQSPNFFQNDLSWRQCRSISISQSINRSVNQFIQSNSFDPFQSFDKSTVSISLLQFYSQLALLLSSLQCQSVYCSFTPNLLYCYQIKSTVSISYQVNSFNQFYEAGSGGPCLLRSLSSRLSFVAAESSLCVFFGWLGAFYRRSFSSLPS